MSYVINDNINCMPKIIDINTIITVPKLDVVPVSIEINHLFAPKNIPKSIKESPKGNSNEDMDIPLK